MFNHTENDMHSVPYIQTNMPLFLNTSEYIRLSLLKDHNIVLTEATENVNKKRMAEEFCSVVLHGSTAYAFKLIVRFEQRNV